MTDLIYRVSVVQQLTEYNVLYAVNNCDEGYINYYSTAYSIEGTYDGIPIQPEYVDNTINLKSASMSLTA